MTATYSVSKAIVGPLLRAVWRPDVEGIENVPESGPLIVAANHLAAADNLFLSLVFPRHLAFMAKAEYFTGNGLKGKAIAAFMVAFGQVAVDRSGGRASVAALDRAIPVLKSGRVFGIFPEGTRSPDGRLYKGRQGVARLALESGAPVLPVGLIGTDKLQPRGTTVPRLGRVHVRIGKPLDFGRYAEMARDRWVLRAITDQIVDEIRMLSGQEYVDRYAPRVTS